MKKVLIDARLSGLKHAGIGRYIQMLVEYLDRLQVTGLRPELRSSTPRLLRLEEPRGYRLQIKTISPDIKHYSFSEQMRMPGILNREPPDLVHFPHFNVPLLYRKPFVVTIHDLLWHEQVGFEATTQPKLLYLLKYFGYRLVMHYAISDSKAIIVPSHWVEKKILEQFPKAAGKIHVIYEGVSEVYKGPTLRTQGRTLSLLEQYGLKPNKFLIYTGSLYPHKNVDLVLNVIQHLKDLKFVVACSRSVFWEKFQKDVRQRGLTDKVILAGFVQDEDLVALYQHALAFIFPSLSEGFGLPGLEAMAAGCPVISSKTGALPEIYGDAAVYFDPKSNRELRREIERMRKDKQFREELVIKGKERVKQFTWGKCAKETLAVYESCLRLRSDQ